MGLKLSKPFFSIIFPVYNVARYLEASLQSILNQTFQDFEIIAINDGSSDGSLEILERIAKNQSKIKVISQKNGGLSDARNTGMQHAQGEYVCFVDSDDLIHPNYLQDFFDVIEKTHAEICKNTNILKFSSTPNMGGGDTPQPKNIHRFSPNNLKIGCNVWSFAFKHSIIKDSQLNFLKGRIFEDEPFVFMILPLAKNIFIFEGSPYFYRQHSQSIVAKSPIAFDRIENFKSIIEWYREKNLLAHFPIPFYILYDVSINNPHYKEYLQKAQEMLHSLALQDFLYQDRLAKDLFQLEIEDFIREHQKSRGKFKYYLRRLFGLL